MSIKQALIASTKKLNEKKIINASLDSEVLLAFVLKKPKEFIYTYPEKKFSAGQQKKYNQLIARRAKGEPVAYLRNFKEFYGLEFYVDKNVLIPRPETELLVDEIRERIRKQEARIKNITIADIGTGSGAIIIALAKILAKSYKLKAKSYYATDISARALNVARKNAKKHKVEIKFLQGDLLQPIKNKKIDIVTANLPYGDRTTWPKRKNPLATSLKFEPKIALYARKSGLELYERLFKQVPELKYLPKNIFIEIDPGQVKKISALAKKYLPNYSLQIKKDLSGLNRILIISN